MNVRMWTHAATQRNCASLKSDGIAFVGPDEGEMACGEFGPGRMAEPAAIADAAARMLVAEGPLSGRRILVTSGPTHEPIDPVRYIANRSSGKQGHAIAAAAARLGAEVTLVSGPVAIPNPPGVKTIRVETARQMMQAVQNAMPADCAIFCAAVADWRVANEGGQKFKKEAGGLPALSLTENPDILATLSHMSDNRPELVIGFAAETEKVIAHAQSKLARKGCDWIVANDVSHEGGVMGGDMNTVHLVTKDGVEDWPKMGKDAVAEKLVARIAATLKGRWV
jgi:phosphopantothenoylcysteine decarboxylase/phosphopantothenate--cysteine ligase